MPIDSLKPKPVSRNDACETVLGSTKVYLGEDAEKEFSAGISAALGLFAEVPSVSTKVQAWAPMPAGIVWPPTQAEYLLAPTYAAFKRPQPDWFY